MHFCVQSRGRKGGPPRAAAGTAALAGLFALSLVYANLQLFPIHMVVFSPYTNICTSTPLIRTHPSSLKSHFSDKSCHIRMWDRYESPNINHFSLYFFFSAMQKRREMPKLFLPYNTQFFFSPSLRQRCITQNCLFKSGIRSPKSNRETFNIGRRKTGS